MAKHRVDLTTKDGVNLVGDYYPGSSKKGVVCLHQFRTDRSIYEDFAFRLQDEGFHVLAIDLRGHGESEGDYKNFSDNDFKNMFSDARAADDFLREKDEAMAVQMVGASIGANTALIYQEMNTLSSVVALSPGLNYHGIDPVDSNLGNIATPVMYVNSETDPYVDETKELYEQVAVLPEDKELKIYPGGDHGMYILDNNPEAFNDVINWLTSH